MAGQKLTDMKSAASDLVNIVVWADQSKYTSRIAIVPFAYDVRLPSCGFHEGHRHYFDDESRLVSSNALERRSIPMPPLLSGQYVMVHNNATTTTTTTGKGKNKVTTTTTTYSPTCDLAASAEALPLSSDKTALLAKDQRPRHGR